MTSKDSQTLLVLGGDGIGPEVTQEAQRVLELLIQKNRMSIRIEERPYGMSSIASCGQIISEETMSLVHSCRAILFGAFGCPEYEKLPPASLSRGDLLVLRRDLQLYANLRPIKPSNGLLNSSPLKPEKIAAADMIVVRELTGGIYYGEPREITGDDDHRRGVDTQVYTTPEIRRVARVAFDLARRRRKKVTSVDKANVLRSSQLWRAEVQRLRDQEFSDIELNHLYVDNCAMQFVLNPQQFDVVLTDNLFGDILSDLGAPIVSSIGMMPSASLNFSGPYTKGLYEPVHGSAPDIAGRGVANPIGAILSAAMCLRWSFGEEVAAHQIETAVENTLEAKYRTADIALKGEKVISTRAMGDAILQELTKL